MNSPALETPIRRLLVLDDEEPLMTALCSLLRHRGYEPVGFTSAEAALEAIRERRFDIALTDLMMPELDGIGFAKRAHEIDPQLVTVMMTGEGSIESAVEAMRSGVLDYILKPFKLSAILPVLERAALVRHLRVQNEELRRLERERTEQLEAANEELQSFCHSVSHDLRSPVRTISALIRLIQEDHGPELSLEAAQMLDRVYANTKRMGQLIEDLLEFSRCSRQALDRQRVDIAAITRAVVADLLTSEENLDVQVQIGELPEAEGDASLLRQVFVNLIGNAIKFSSKSAGAVVRIEADEENGIPVYRVQDTGAGFDPAFADRLFSPFERLHPSSEFEGSGVGLSMVKRIVERHGGRVWAEGAVGQGATFSFTLASQAA